MLQALQWPISRNELLQILIKKNWDRSLFEAFCEVLRETQNPQLNNLVTTKAKDLLEGKCSFYKSWREIEDIHEISLKMFPISPTTIYK